MMVIDGFQSKVCCNAYYGNTAENVSEVCELFADFFKRYDTD